MDRKKIHVVLPEKIHRKLRICVAHDDSTIQEYVSRLIKEDMSTYQFSPVIKTAPRKKKPRE